MFGRVVLAKPLRGGGTRNLPNLLIRRCNEHIHSNIQNMGNIEEPSTLTGSRVGRKQKGGEDVEQRRLDWIAKSVSMKLEEGNFKGAVRLLCSDDTQTQTSPDTLKRLREKHACIPPDRRPLTVSTAVSAPVFTEAQVRKAVFTFPAGSSAGHDGLSPQHMKDMISSEGDTGPMLKALTTLINNLIVNGIRPEIPIRNTTSLLWCSSNSLGQKRRRD